MQQSQSHINIMYRFLRILFILITVCNILFKHTVLLSAEENKQETISSKNIKKSEPEKEEPISAKENKIHITSDSMMVEKESSIINFSGNVAAVQGDNSIKADNISVILFTDKEKKALSKEVKQEIKSMTAYGNVRFYSGNRTAFAENAVYTGIDQKIILTGKSVKVITGESYVTGEKITLFQNSGKVIVEGGKEKRVEALFNSKEDFKQK